MICYPAKAIKHIVIIGAGPMGLYLANQLRQKGVENIIVIDPRAGTYTRPGHLDKKHLPEFQKRLMSPLEYKVGVQLHIKDIERYFYQIAESANISMIRGKFVTFSKGQIQIENEKGFQCLPCDLAFDCTGQHREVVKEINRLRSDNSPFHIVKVNEPPIKTHLAAYVKMARKDFEDLEDESKLSLSEQARILVDLQEKFSWNSYEAPYFRIDDFGKNKVLIYCEIPPNLPPDEQENWLKALFELQTGRKDISFNKLENSRKYGKKPRFVAFTVDPHEVVEPCYQGDQDIPMTFVAGDAQIEPDYRLAIGLLSGANRIDSFIEAMSIKTGNITAINIPQYKHDLAKFIEMHKNALNEFYTPKKIVESTQLVIERCEKFFDDKKIFLKNPEARVDITKNLYKRALVRYYAALDAKQEKIRFDSECNISNEKILLLGKKLLLKAITIAEKNDANYSMIEETLLDMVKKIKNAASNLFNQEKYEASEFHYQELLTIHLKDLIKQDWDEIAKIYSNLVLIAKKNKDAEKVKKTAKEALDLLYAKLPSNHKMIGKILFNQIDSILDEAGTYSANSIFNRGRVNEHLKFAEKLLRQLSKNGSINDHDLYEKYSMIARKHNLKIDL